MALLSGIITVTTAGTAVQGSDSLPGTYMLRPDPANTGDYVYIGNDGADDVSSTTGLKMGSGNVALVTIANLNLLYFDADSDGDILTWAMVDGHTTLAARIYAVLSEDRAMVVNE